MTKAAPPIDPLDLTVEQGDLARALRLVGRAAPSRSSLPILGHVLLDAAPGRLTLTATDLSLALMAAIPGDVARPGRVALPAELLGNYAAHLPAGAVRLTGEPDTGRVRAARGRASARLAALEASAFPSLPMPDLETALALDARALRRALARAVPAVARDESRPVLGAILFAVGREGLTLAAADGVRLARTWLPARADEDRQVLVPARAASEATRLLGDDDTARLVVLPDDRGLWLVAGAAGLYTRLVAGPFPDVAALIPGEWRTRVTVGRAALLAALRRAELFGQERPGARPVVLSAMIGRLRVGAWGAELGETDSEIAADLEGAPERIALDTRLLVDLLASVGGGRLALSWRGPEGALVVREVGETVGAGDVPRADLWLVMPLHEPQLLRRQIAADGMAEVEAAGSAAVPLAEPAA